MKAYISCPLVVSMNNLEEVTLKLVSLGYTPDFYTRGTTYTTEKLLKSDIFILFPPNNQFDFPVDNMSAGCKSELLLASSIFKPLYIAYYKEGKTLRIYPIKLNKLKEGRVMGESGVYLPEVQYQIKQIIYSIY